MAVRNWWKKSTLVRAYHRLTILDLNINKDIPVTDIWISRTGKRWQRL